jgi:hypothetical protein
LKQSGQPESGAADNSSRSNSSSEFFSTCNEAQKRKLCSLQLPHGSDYEESRFLEYDAMQTRSSSAMEV